MFINLHITSLLVTWWRDTNSHFWRWLSPWLWCSSQARLFVHVHSQMVPRLLTSQTLDTKTPKCPLEAVAFNWVELLLGSHFLVFKIQAQVEMLSFIGTYLIKCQTYIHIRIFFISSNRNFMQLWVERWLLEQPWWVIGGTH